MSSVRREPRVRNRRAPTCGAARRPDTAREHVPMDAASAAPRRCHRMDGGGMLVAWKEILPARTGTRMTSSGQASTVLGCACGPNAGRAWRSSVSRSSGAVLRTLTENPTVKGWAGSTASAKPWTAVATKASRAVSRRRTDDVLASAVSGNGAGRLASSELANWDAAISSSATNPSRRLFRRPPPLGKLPVDRGADPAFPDPRRGSFSRIDRGGPAGVVARADAHAQPQLLGRSPASSRSASSAVGARQPPESSSMRRSADSAPRRTSSSSTISCSP